MPASQPNADVPARTFDGMLAAPGIVVSPALLEELRQVGYDRAAPASAYDVRIWRGTLEVLRRHHFLELEPADGLRELGRRFAEGFGRTPVGWVFRSVAPLFGVDRTLLVLPRYLHTIRRQMELSIHAEGANCYRLKAVDPLPSPEFIAGCLQGILDIFSLTGQIEVVSADDASWEILVRW